MVIFSFQIKYLVFEYAKYEDTQVLFKDTKLSKDANKWKFKEEILHRSNKKTQSLINSPQFVHRKV